MSLALDPATEERIRRQLDRSQFEAPAELINHPLDLIEAEESEAIARRDAMLARLNESYAQSERGEGYSPEEARAALAERRAARQQ